MAMYDKELEKDLVMLIMNNTKMKITKDISIGTLIQHTAGLNPSKGLYLVMRKRTTTDNKLEIVLMSVTSGKNHGYDVQFLSKRCSIVSGVLNEK